MSRPYRINWVASGDGSTSNSPDTRAALGPSQTYVANRSLYFNQCYPNNAFPSPTQYPPQPTPVPPVLPVVPPGLGGSAVMPATAAATYPLYPVNGTVNDPYLPLTLTSIYGPINSVAMMPQDNIRNVTLTATAGDSSAVNFLIIGQVETGLVVSETIQGPAATATVSSAKHYFKVLSIIPNGGTGAAGTTVSIGYGAAGYTMPFQADYWRKQVQLSFVVENVNLLSAPTVAFKLFPEMTLDQGQLFINRQMVPQPQTWLTMAGALDEYVQSTSARPPVGTQGQPNFGAVTGTAPNAAPFMGLAAGSNTSWSLRSYPVVATRVLVNDAPDATPSTLPLVGGSFTLVTLQQGAR